MPPKVYAPIKVMTPLEKAKATWNAQPFSVYHFNLMCKNIDPAERDEEGNSFIHWTLQNFPRVESEGSARATRARYIDSIAQMIKDLPEDKKKNLLFQPNKKNHLLIHTLAMLPDLKAACSLIKAIHDTNPKDNNVVMTGTQIKYDDKAVEAIAAPVLQSTTFEKYHTLAHRLATQASKGAILELLTLYGIIDINLKSSSGRTPLCLAIQKNSPRIIEHMFRLKNRDSPILNKKTPKIEESPLAIKALMSDKTPDDENEQYILKTLQTELKSIETNDKPRATKIKEMIDAARVAAAHNIKHRLIGHRPMKKRETEGKEEKEEKEGKRISPKIETLSHDPSLSSSSSTPAATPAKQAASAPSSASAASSQSASSSSSTRAATPAKQAASAPSSASVASSQSAPSFSSTPVTATPAKQAAPAPSSASAASSQSAPSFSSTPAATPAKQAAPAPSSASVASSQSTSSSSSTPASTSTKAAAFYTLKILWESAEFHKEEKLLTLYHTLYAINKEDADLNGDAFISWAISHLQSGANEEEKANRKKQLSLIKEAIAELKREKIVTPFIRQNKSSHIFLHRLAASLDPLEAIDIINTLCDDKDDGDSYSQPIIEEPVTWKDYPYKFTLQHYLAIRSNYALILEKLLIFNIIKDINLKSSDGRTVLCYILGHSDPLSLQTLFRTKDTDEKPIKKIYPNISQSPDAIKLLATPIPAASRTDAFNLLKNHWDRLKKTGELAEAKKIEQAVEAYQKTSKASPATASLEKKSSFSLSSSSSSSSELSSSPASSAASSPLLPEEKKPPASPSSSSSSSSELSSSLASSAVSSHLPYENKVAYEAGILIGDNQVIEHKDFTAHPEELLKHLNNVFGDSPCTPEYKKQLEDGYYKGILLAANELKKNDLSRQRSTLLILGNLGIRRGCKEGEIYFRDHRSDLKDEEKLTNFINKHLIKPEDSYGRDSVRYNHQFQLYFHQTIKAYTLADLYVATYPTDLKKGLELESFINSHLIPDQDGSHKSYNHELKNSFYRIINYYLAKLRQTSYHNYYGTLYITSESPAPSSIILGHSHAEQKIQIK